MTSILVTGGTGTFGQAFVRHLLAQDQLTHHPDERAIRVAIYSRDEAKQAAMREALHDDPRLRFFIGDVRDLDRLRMAMRGVDTVVHAAALKHVDIGEREPFEFHKTNVCGASNVIEAALWSDSVERVVALSTDKAVDPVNTYGATKMLAERMFIGANGLAGRYGPRFSLVRYGNVIGSRGSVVERFRGASHVQVTDPTWTRFWLRIGDAVALVDLALSNMVGGEIFIPLAPTSTIDTLFEAIAPGAERSIVGSRPGEKAHEVLTSAAESPRVYGCAGGYLIKPEVHPWTDAWLSPLSLTPTAAGWYYSSETAVRRLGVEELRELIGFLGAVVVASL